MNKNRFFSNSKFLSSGQLVILVVLLFYILAMFLLVQVLGLKHGLGLFDIPTMTPLFADLHVIVGGYETLQEGGNPYIQNPHDPWGRLYNYPRIWMSLGLLGLDHINLFYLAVTMGLIYLTLTIKLVGKLSIRQGLYASFVICSPASFLAIERANSDIIIYILLVSSLLLINKTRKNVPIWSTMTIIMAAILKLYPVFAVSLFFGQNKRIFYLAIGIVFTIFVVYCALTWNDLTYIFNNTPRGPNRSYGAAVLPMFVLFQMFGDTSYTKFYPLIGLIVGNVLLIVSFLIIFLRIRTRSIPSLYDKGHSQKLLSFWLGSGIFIGTFILGNNWDYRLIFLIFLVPQLLEWFRSQKDLKPVLLLTLITLATSIQGSFISPEAVKRIIVINEIQVWILVCCVLYLSLLSLPDWFKRTPLNLSI